MSYTQLLSTILKSSFKALIALLFVGSIAMNIITMTWTTEGIAAKGALAAVASITSVAADLGIKLAINEKVITDLRGELDASEEVATGLRGELAANKKVITDLGNELATKSKAIIDLGIKLAAIEIVATGLKNRLDANKKAVSQITEGIAKRTIRGVRRSLAAIPADFIPFVGDAIAHGVTVLEIKDACETIEEMDEMNKSMGNEVTVEKDKVCGVKIPSEEEIVKAIKSSPGKVLASVREFGVDIPEDIPEDIREDIPEDAHEDDHEDAGKSGGFFRNSWQSARKYFSDD